MDKDTAIVTYVDNKPHLIEEFGWLFRSWIDTRSYEMSDLICFHHPAIPCEKLPITFVKYIKSQPITEINPMWSGHPWINSVAYLLKEEARWLADRYKYILRTDGDCFLTKNFKNLRPRLPLFGAGLYSHNPGCMSRLLAIHEELGLAFCFSNIGATLFASSEQVLTYSKYHYQYCNHLLANSFNDGIGEWPGWWKGTLTMYGGLIAANAYFGTGMTIGGLDCHSEACQEIGSNDYHIHAFHCNNFFSKHAWRRGEYNQKYLDKDYDRDTINGLCLHIAGRKN